MGLVRPRHVSPFPDMPDGWSDIAQAITVDGKLLCLTAAQDVLALPGMRPDEADCPPIAARLTEFDGAAMMQQADLLLEYRYPLFDRVPDGNWILSNAWCPVEEARSMLLAPDGAVLGQLCLGDGIEHLQCDSDGNIWCGYFDHGIFGNNYWDRPGGLEPIGGVGLVKFDQAGKVLWRYADPTLGDFPLDDCYALNVTDSAWASFYGDFPIMHVDSNHQIRLWTNWDEAAGPWAIAVEGNHVLLAGGYDGGTRLVLHCLQGEVAEQVDEARIALPPGTSPKDVRLIGRGDQLHVIHDRSWGRISVSDMLQLSRRS